MGGHVSKSFITLPSGLCTKKGLLEMSRPATCRTPLHDPETTNDEIR